MLFGGGYWGGKYMVDIGRLGGDKMTQDRTLVRYRTTDIPYPQFVVIPNMFVSNMLHWLSDHECAEIEHTELSDNDFHFPTDWHSYLSCWDYIVKRNLLTETR